MLTQHYDEGALRAYLAGVTTPQVPERAPIEAHLAACPACRNTLTGLRRVEDQVGAQIATLAPAQTPDAQAALRQFRWRAAQEAGMAARHTTVSTHNSDIYVPATPARRTTLMQTLTLSRPGPRRALFSGLAAAMLVLGFAGFPSVRAAADQFLQTFRAQQVMFVPVGPDRIAQLKDLNFDPTRMFVSKPVITGGATRQVGTLAEAAQQTGFTPEQPHGLPGSPSPQVSVYERSHATFQVDVNALRQVLAALGINDVSLPDGLDGGTISADLPPAALQRYTASNYELNLVQGRSPTVNLPGGVDMAHLGKAALRVLGMDPAQADSMSKQIDWSSTLIVPFPSNMKEIRQVQIGDAQGLLVDAGASNVLYWQRGDRFYVIEATGEGMPANAMLAAAQGVK